MTGTPPLPAGASPENAGWDDDGTRVITAQPRRVSGVTVVGSAIQFRDGHTEAPLVVVGAGDLTPDEARRLAAALLDAAAELEGWPHDPGEL